MGTGLFETEKDLSREMYLAPRSMSRVLKGLAAYWRCTDFFFIDILKNNSVVKSIGLLKRNAKGGNRKILFTDENFLQLSNILTNQMIIFMLEALIFNDFVLMN